MNFLFACKNTKIKSLNKESTIVENIMNKKMVSDYADGIMADRFDTVSFGLYEQDGNTEKGKEKIEWFILDKDLDSGKALLVSKYILDTSSFGTSLFSIDWENSDIRKWLNSNFYNEAFNEEEKNYILEVNNTNQKEPKKINQYLMISVVLEDLEVSVALEALEILEVLVDLMVLIIKISQTIQMIKFFY